MARKFILLSSATYQFLFKRACEQIQSDMGAIHRVMLVDDDEINNLICTRTMRELKFAKHISSFSKAKDGLNFLKDKIGEIPEEIPDVIFLDINMPSMNGWDFLEEFKDIRRALHKDIMVFVLSASINDEDISLAIDHAEVDDYLIKPLNRSALKEVLETHFPGE